MKAKKKETEKLFSTAIQKGYIKNSVFIDHLVELKKEQLKQYSDSHIGSLLGACNGFILEGQKKELEAILSKNCQHFIDNEQNKLKSFLFSIGHTSGSSIFEAQLNKLTCELLPLIEIGKSDFYIACERHNTDASRVLEVPKNKWLKIWYEYKREIIIATIGAIATILAAIIA